MGVKLASTAGFCMGVRRAVDIVLDLAQNKGSETLYTYGPLIHNPQTIDLLLKRGVVPISGPEDLDRCQSGATILIRAHGISPGERRKIEEKNLRIVDATCPKVARVQAIIKKHAAQGRTILIVGDSRHPEVNGLMGYSLGRGIAIGHPEDICNLPSLNQVCIVAQTTQDMETYKRIVQKAQERFPNLQVFDTICESTKKRQEEVKELAAEMDVVFIVGGKNSANTRRLASLSSRGGTPTFHIESTEDIKDIPLDRYEKIGVSAGASTPNWIIDRVVDYLAGRPGEKKSKIAGLFRLWIMMIKTDLYSAIGAACLSLVGMILQSFNIHIRNVLTAALYVFAMHTFNRLISQKTSIIGSFREEFYLQHDKIAMGLSCSAMVLALASAAFTGPSVFILLIALTALGILYNITLLPDRWRFRSFRDLPGSKNVAMALAWALVTSLVPRFEAGPELTSGLIIAFLFTFTLVFTRSVLSDILDIQSDRLIGRETIAVLIGKERTTRLLKDLAILITGILIVSYPAGWTSWFAWILLLCIFYIWICLKLCDRRARFSGVFLEGLLETAYIIAGLCAIGWVVMMTPPV
ncbi:MAG: 4-hydroxy-3-methylbut-2-enyl diphosphate reductase [Syntrophales bacterium]|jgi:4-hydroxy-3-methylbut-2-enyl diphosphate reductase